MKPSEIELKQIRLQEERFNRFKEHEFTRLGLDDPYAMFFLVCIFSIPIFGWALLLISLMHEVIAKWCRMGIIVIQILMFKITKPFRK